MTGEIELPRHRPECDLTDDLRLVRTFALGEEIRVCTDCVNSATLRARTIGSTFSINLLSGIGEVLIVKVQQ